jgi:hypothetical protein
MSDHAHSPKAGEPPDEVQYGKVVGVGVASLAIFAISIAWAGWLWKAKIADAEAATGKARVLEAKTVGTEVGIVDQVPFVVDKRLPKWQQERREHLSSYGWVDRGKGVVHIPIDQAIEQVLAGGGPAGAPK